MWREEEQLQELKKREEIERHIKNKGDAIGQFFSRCRFQQKPTRAAQFPQGLFSMFLCLFTCSSQFFMFSIFHVSAGVFSGTPAGHRRDTTGATERSRSSSWRSRTRNLKTPLPEDFFTCATSHDTDTNTEHASARFHVFMYSCVFHMFTCFQFFLIFLFSSMFLFFTCFIFSG